VCLRGVLCCVCELTICRQDPVCVYVHARMCMRVLRLNVFVN